MKSGVLETAIPDHFRVIRVIPNACNRANFTQIQFHCLEPHNLNPFRVRVDEMARSFAFYNNMDVHVQCKLICEKLFPIYYQTCSITFKTIPTPRLEAP